MTEHTPGIWEAVHVTTPSAPGYQVALLIAVALLACAWLIFIDKRHA
jgi:hypothetical protein